MTNLHYINILKLLLVVFLIGIFGVFYWQTVMSLSLFGDATIHGYNAKTLMERGLDYLNADYPPFYYFAMTVLFQFFGEKGFNLVPYIGVLFLLISSFLFIRQITKNYYLGLLSIILVGSSPKIIYYSARMYQEILITALFVFSFYLLFKYLEKRKRNLLILLLFFIGISLSLKQQGLFILYSSIIIFFIFDFIKKRTSLQNLSLVIFLPILIGLPFYGVLFHTKGEIQPGSNEFELFKVINNFGQKIFLYNGEKNKVSDIFNSNNNLLVLKAYASNNSITSDSLQKELNNINFKYSKLADARAENRHIWPTDVFLNFNKFNQANSLYLLTWQGVGLESPILFYFSFIFLVGGFFFCLYKYKIYTNLLLFTIVFLPINYSLFIRNNDQQRYQLFIPIYLLAFIFVFLSVVIKRININNIYVLFLVTITLILVFIPILVPMIQRNELWGNSQIYSPSEGGINSVKETANWLNKNTKSSTIIGQVCGDETEYYSDRKLISDWRADFLDKKSLQTYFTKYNISYYVIFKSQLVNDNQWTSLCWIPMSFYNRLNNSYPKAYISNSNDIVVYNVYQK